jgi:hypothetical protein
VLVVPRTLVIVVAEAKYRSTLLCEAPALPKTVRPSATSYSMRSKPLWSSTSVYSQGCVTLRRPSAALENGTPARAKNGRGDAFFAAVTTALRN